MHFCYDLEDEYEPICTVVSMEYESQGLDLYSDASASLKIRGHLLPGVLPIPSKADAPQVQYQCRLGKSLIHMLPDRPHSEAFYTTRDSLPELAAHSEEEVGAAVHLFALLMARPRGNLGFEDETDAATVDYEAECWLTLMVLIESPDAEDTYIRVGLANRVSSSSMPEKWYKRWPIVEFDLI